MPSNAQQNRQTPQMQPMTIPSKPKPQGQMSNPSGGPSTQVAPSPAASAVTPSQSASARRRPTMHLLRRLSRRRDAPLRKSHLPQSNLEGDSRRQMRTQTQTHHRLRQAEQAGTPASSAPTPATVASTPDNKEKQHLEEATRAGGRRRQVRRPATAMFCK